MIFEEFQEIFLEELKKINLKIEKEKIKKFYEYMKILIEWNEKINLTAIKDEKEIIVKHFIDSLTINKYIGNAENMVDVGTGAGFPGIPIKIVNKDLTVILVDSLNKRINFLNEVIEKLDLQNIKTVHARAEDLGKDKQYRESFDVVTSRAVANMTVLTEYLLPLTKIGGNCICMKGAEIEDELENAKYAIKLLGGKVVKVEKIEISDEHMGRNIILIKKQENTPNQYPRKAGIPLKKPLLKE